MTDIKKSTGKTAVVIGGSMAGLLSARVLSDFYEQVIVVERDELPTAAEPRKGVPQGRHAHALLGRGRQIMETLLPGLTEQLVQLGAAQGYGRFFSGGGYLVNTPAVPKGLFVSRPCLETAVRGRLQALPNVYMIDNCHVLSLLTTEAKDKIIGVRLRQRHEGAVEEQLMADLVVDASGRGSRTPNWLEELGYEKPAVELVEVNMGYATRFYRRRTEHLNGDLLINIAPSPTNMRACGMIAQEGDRWIVTLAGYFGDNPPTDEQGYLEFARKLPTSDVYEFLRTAEPLTEAVAFKFPSNQRRHYEKLGRFPEGLLVIGDALCSFTPIYGQGMTVASLEAITLQECLTAGTQRLAQRFFQQASKIIDIPWNIAVGNDLRLAPDNPAYSRPMRLINWYMSKLQIAARHDPVVATAFMMVANLFELPPTVMRPRIAWRVLWGNLRHGRPQKQQRQPEILSPAARP